MPFSRSTRTDRRRRVMREAVAADAGVAVESVRAKQRRRARDGDDSANESHATLKRDPGYSQAVRRACQQRLVQLIPVRRSSLLLTIAGLWTVWSILLFAHYYVHVQSGASNRLLPVAALVHLRSTHGIAHWLGGQLWMLTALASLMIYQLRKHKLDDYRAKYRVWGLLAIAALISSLDASSSGLQLFGMSIDGWARREVGYSGWSVVLASFATLVGVLGLRVCSEIKSAPMSLTFWLGGLVAWAFSALIGTGLMLTPWSRTTIDLVVGGAWLGGILSVFLAAGIYLRHIYIQAQKRFMLRNGMLSQGKVWKLPRFTRRSRSAELNHDDHSDKRNEKLSSPQPENDHSDEDETRAERTQRRNDHRSETDEPTKKRRWFRLPRWKSDPRLGDDFSDVAAEHRMRDEGFNEPYGKKAGWFSKKQSTSQTVQSKNRSVAIPQRDSNQNRDGDADNASTPDFQEVKPERQSWWKRKVSSQSRVQRPEKTNRASPSIDAGPITSKRRWFQKSPKPTAASSTSASKPNVKRSWSILKKRPVVEGNSTASQTPPVAGKRPKRKFFGFLDKLQLKPPVDAKAKSAPIPVSSNRTSFPSSSVAQRTEPPKAASPYNTSRPTQQVDDEDYDDDSNRNLSKADRKRLRRQQQENRRAA